MTGSNNQIMCEADAEATRSSSLQKSLVGLFWAPVPRPVLFFFLERGYFPGAVISAIPHQAPSRALRPRLTKARQS